MDVNYNFRKKRFNFFLRMCEVDVDTNILDIGGLPWDWIKFGWKGKVTCLSLSNLQEGLYGDAKNIEYKKVDAKSLPFNSNSIDVVYCNSLLEHVGKENQQLVANEIKRVAKKYWVQIPNKYFILEPHYKFPLYHLFPLSTKKMIVKYWTVGMLNSKSYSKEVESLYIPTRKEFISLFPDATHVSEKVFLYPKSWMCYKN